MTQKLQFIQNAAARLLVRASRGDITPGTSQAASSLLCPLEEGEITFKAQHELGPGDLMGCSFSAMNVPGP